MVLKNRYGKEVLITGAGSGLGLAIAKDLAKLMNGVFEITIDGDLFKATVMMEEAK